MCGPLGWLVVGHWYQSVVPVFVTVCTTTPSTSSFQVFVTPHGDVVLIPSDWVRRTVAPSAGYVNLTLKGAGRGAFDTVSVIVAVAERPAPFETVTVRTWLPDEAVVVFQDQVAVVPVTVWVETTALSIAS